MSSSPLRRAQESLDRSAESLWSWCFARLSAGAAQGAQPWAALGGASVLVVAPHPDDEVCGCAGVIARHVCSADRVCVVHVTDGRRSRAWGLAPQVMAERRRHEADACAQALGVQTVEWLGEHEGEWDANSVQARLAALLRAYAPQIVYAPSRIDFHPEHWRVAHALAQALGDDAGYVLRVYQVQVPLTPVLTNCVADVSCVNEACARAFEAYASQRASITRCWRMRRYGASVYGCMRHAEEFWQMSARAYRRLHQAEPRRWRSRSFRALRAHALGDPLAYASGRRERRRLAHASGA